MDVNIDAAASPFHAGERAVQERLGVRERIEPFARRVVRPYLTEQLREFFGQLPWVVAAARDPDGRPWVTLLAGEPGFAHSPHPERLRISGHALPGDALEGALVPGAELGLLGIDLQTRRRNRVNGRIRTLHGDEATLLFDVGQAFGNCPQYIVERAWYPVAEADRAPTVERLDALDAAAVAAIRAADTLFLGSGIEGDADDVRNGLDASHRGGSPGFVHVEDAHHFVIPDYAGNNHYNTIGNLVVDPRVAVTFVDFETGSVLQITGRAEVDFEPDDAARFPGALRLIHVHVDAVVRLGDALPMRWNPPQGAVREFRIAERIRESEDVTSFLLVGRDDGPAPDFEAGQHLPLEFAVAGSTTPVRRSYSLSNGPGEGHLRFSVKREDRGLVSRHLHDALDVGDCLLVSPPAGDFVMQDGDRPLVLLGAGIGVTPLVSMLRTLVARGDGRDVLFAHGVRDGDHHPFADEVRGLVNAHGDARSLVAYSRPRATDRLGTDHDHAGRLSAELLLARGADPEADYYLCGPPAFVAELTDDLVELGVAETRIRAETF